jgi:AcrR family transcriptional regulator
MVEVSSANDGAKVSSRLGRGKRNQVIDAAVELFLMNGYDQTSMDGIAARAGVSKTTVYAHYADKLALFKAVVERAAESLAIEPKERKRVPASEGVEERLTHLIVSVIEATIQPDFRAFLRIMISESARHPDLAEIMRAPARVDVAGRIADLLAEDAAANGRKTADPLAEATFLLRMASAGPQLDSLLFPKFEPKRAQLEAHTRHVVAIFLRGVKPPSGKSPAHYPYPWVTGVPDGDKPAR